MKYRKRPVEIDAIQFTRNNFDEIVSFTNGAACCLCTEKCPNGKCTCVIPTLEGDHIASEGDYIIKGVHGEFYPCKPDIFAETYEIADDVMGNKETKFLYDIFDTQTGDYIKTDCKLIAIIPAGAVLTNEEIREYYGIDQDHRYYERARCSTVRRLVFDKCIIPDSSFYKIERVTSDV